jgi:hypothetical protein
MPVLATMLAGGLLTLAAYAGVGVLAVAAIGLAALLAYGLLAASDLPEQVPAGLLIVLTAVGSVVSVLASDVEPGAETSFAPVLRAVGPAMVAVLLVVLARPAARERAVDWLAVTGAGVLIAALAGAVVALGRLEDLGPELVAIMAAAAVVGSAVAVRPLHRLGWLWSLGWLAAGAVAELAVPIGRVEETDRLVVAITVALVAGVTAAAATGAPQADRSTTHWSIRAARVGGIVLALAAPVAATTVRVLLA